MGSLSAGGADTAPLLPQRARRATLALCCAVAIADGFDTQAIGFVAPVLGRELAIDARTMGAIFAAGLLGLMVGALTLSVLADRIGRRPVIIGSVLTFGVFALATTTAQSAEQVLMWRFLTGLGLGGALPNVNALAAEVSPPHRRALLMTLMFSGFPLGGVIGGLVSGRLIAEWGWESVFVLGGVVPLLLVPMLLVGLRESPELAHPAERREAPGPRGLFGEGRTIGTLMLWVACFSGLLLMYALFNWLPSVLASAGVPLERAILASAAFNLGGIFGGVVLAVLLDRRLRTEALAATFALAAVATFALGRPDASPFALFALVFAAGAAIIGTQLGLNAVMANHYPTRLRSTGIGWALGVGRLGSVLGPFAVGLIVAAQATRAEIFGWLALPALAAAGAIWIFARSTRRTARLEGEARQASG